MKTINSSLLSFLVGNTNFNRAELITIVLPNGLSINALGRTNVTQFTYPVGLPTTVTIPGTSYPWKTNDPSYPFTGSGGSSAVSVSMSQGQIITLTYGSGSITAAGDLVDPTGTFGAVSSSFPGYYVLDKVVPVRALIGGFVNASGWLIAPPFYIGSGQVIGPAPADTANLVLGVNDSATWVATGSWVMNITPPTYYSTLYGAWERGPYTNTASFSVQAGSLELTGIMDNSINFPGTTSSLMQALNQGVLNGAKVIVQQYYWPLGTFPSGSVSMGTMQLMIGQIGNVKSAERGRVVCDVFDLTYIMNRPFPPHLIYSSCRHTFCDKGCTLSINNFRSTAYALDSSSTNLYLNLTVPPRANTTAYKFGNLIFVGNVLYMCTHEGTSGGSSPLFVSNRGSITTDGSAQWTSVGTGTNNSFSLGYVLFTSGQNKGFRGTIKLQTVSSSFPQIQLLKPMPFAVSNTDTVRLFFGCDKTFATCENFYINLIHFGGMPFVPNPEIAQ